MADLYGEFVARVLFPAWETGVQRRGTLKILRELERNQWRSLDELQAFQLGELRRLLAHAHANVPYYRRVMDEAGMSPESLRHVDDIRKLPILTRPLERQIGDERRSTAPPLPSICKRTGGTTGEPLMVRYDVESDYWREAIKLRGYGWAGHRTGDKTLHFWGVSVRPDNRLLPRIKRELGRAAKRQHYFNCSPRGPEELGALVRFIAEERPSAIIAYAQACADLARYVNRTGTRTWDDMTVICGAERLFPADRAEMEQAFGPDVFETYGCREVMLIGTECKAHDGLHLSMENLLVELVVRDGDRERPAEPGERGEVVITDLHNYGMPFVRYATGDVAVAQAPAACACGRAHPRLASVEGRVTETLRDSHGNPIDGMIFNLIVALLDDVAQFQAVQHADSSITVKLLPKTTISEGSLSQLRHEFGRFIPDTNVAIEIVNDIPLTAAGKRKIVAVEPQL